MQINLQKNENSVHIIFNFFREVLDEHLEGAGIILALAMTTGLAGGSAFSFLFVKLV